MPSIRGPFLSAPGFAPPGIPYQHKTTPPADKAHARRPAGFLSQPVTGPSHMATPIRLVALISGGGTTLQNLIDRIAAGKLNAAIAGVVSSRADVPGMERARKAGIPVTVVPRASGGREPP